MPRTAIQMTCPECGSISPCKRRSETEVRIVGGYPEPRSGRFVVRSEPEIDYYRRIRECGSCGLFFATAEVDEGLLAELDELRTEVRAARSATTARRKATKDALQKLRQALDVER